MSKFSSSLALKAFFISHVFFKAATTQSEKKEILILGGNGFLGSATTATLLEKGHNITLLNRGNTYYDSDKRIKPYVSKHIECDREKSLILECKELFANETKYDVVVDFTSYAPKHIEQVLEALKGRIGFYVFISSEAVYEVSSKNHTQPSKEREAKRPNSPKQTRELNEEYPYADGKLACEETLERQSSRENGSGKCVPYIILRLPVAIGPRDTTYRWWIYQLWILTHDVINHPVHIPNGVRSDLFSLVYVDDVADVISKVVSLQASWSIKNKVVNIAMKEHITLPRLLRDIASYYGIDRIQHVDDDNSTWYVYPAGTKGPLDISLAEELIDWDPVSWKQAFHKTCDFYHNAMTKVEFVTQREFVLADMLEDIVPDDHYGAFLLKLKQVFGESVLSGINLDVGMSVGAPEIEDNQIETAFAENNGRVVEEL